MYESLQAKVLWVFKNILCHFFFLEEVKMINRSKKNLEKLIESRERQDNEEKWDTNNTPVGHNKDLCSRIVNFILE
jgi:hypothetical protein